MKKNLLSLLLAIIVFIPSLMTAQQIQPSAIRQIRSLIDEKASRTNVQKKLDCNLWYGIKMARGQRICAEVDKLEVKLNRNNRGLVLVEIDATVTPALTQAILAAKGEIISSVPAFHRTTANLPLESLESIAALQEVKSIFPSFPAQLVDEGSFKTTNKNRDNDGKSGKYRKGFKERVELVKSQLLKSLEKLKGLHTNVVASAISEGDEKHKAKLARSMFSVDGSGIKIGILSDSYDTRSDGTNASDDVLSGDLPGPGNPNGYTTPVTVLSEHPGGTDEGRAMLQIVHDLAPGAQLYFATAFNGEADFAQQILNLRAAGCQIICDDVFYFDEPPFQDGILANAVNTVTADGALYFSSAGNAGNLNDGTSGVWEGDFNDAGTSVVGSVTLPGGTVHNFGSATNTQLTLAGRALGLFWSDPVGASGNDYDLFCLNSSLTAVVSSGTTVQSGTQNPWELINTPAAGSRIVIVKKASASVRALHLNTIRGRLSIATSGQTHGHASAENAFAVAATPVQVSGYFNSSNKVETFSSDGLRTKFLNPDGSVISGDVTFASGGGVTLQKPDITAADGVLTTLPASSGLNPFFGTSAAAPHAAAIAGLILSKFPAISPADVRTALTSTAIDIEDAGPDRDAGHGIVSAVEAMGAAGGDLKAYLGMGTVTATEGSYGNGNGVLESGEGGALVIQLNDITSAPATAITATLSCSTPGVTVYVNNSGYSDISGLGSVDNSATPFRIAIDKSVGCGAVLNFSLLVSYTGGFIPSQTFNFTIQTGTTVAPISATMGAAPPTGADYIVTSGTQTGRLTRNGITPSCGAAKAYPGLFTASGSRAYHAYTFTNSSTISQCVTVSVASSRLTDLYEVVYGNGGFVVSNLQTNYVADQGTTTNNVPFSFNAPAGESFTIVVHEVNSGGGTGASYTLSVGLKKCGSTPLCTTVSIDQSAIGEATVTASYSQSFSATGGSGIYNFTQNGTLPNGITFSGNTLSGIPTQSGTFPITITATDLTGCTAGVTNYDLKVNCPAMTLNITDPAPVCAPATVDITDPAIVSGSTPGLLYTYWNDAAASADPVSNPAAVGNGTYYIKGDNVPGCGLIKPVTVTVHPKPDAIAAPASQTICSGAPITSILLSGGVPGTIFKWTRDNVLTVTGMEGLGEGNIAGSLTNTTNAPITVTFTIVPSANGCTGDPVTATVLVNPTPVADQPGNQIVCNNENVAQVVFSSPVSGAIFNWENDNPSIGLPVSGSGDISSFAAVNATNAVVTAHIKVTPSTLTCPGTGNEKIFTISVKPTPDASINPNGQVVCSGKPLTEIVVSGGINGTVFNWTRQNDPTITGIPYSGAGNISGTIFSTNNSAVVFDIRFTPVLNGCSGTPVIAVIRVNPSPVVVVTNPDGVCNATTADITSPAIIAGSTPGLSYSYWYDSDATNPIADPTAVSTGTYYIKGANASGCSDIKPVTVSIGVPPVLAVTNPASVCSPNTANLTSASVTTGSTPGITLSYWNDAAATSSPVLNPAAVTAGTYYIRGTATNGCFEIKPVVVSVATPPVASISVANAPFCSGLTLTANATTAGPFTYEWYRPGNVLLSTAPSINLNSANADGVYMLYVTNGASCRSQAVTYNYQKQSVTGNYVVLGLKDVKLGQTNIVNGSVGNTAAGKKVDIDKNSTVNGFVRSAVITLTAPVTVTGGLIYSPSVVTLPAMQINTAVVPAGNFSVADNATATIGSNYTNLTIGKAANVTINGTVYGKITIGEGAKVTFTQAVVDINDLSIQPGKANVNYTTVNFSGAAVRMKNVVNVGDRTRVNGNNTTFYMGDSKPDAEKFTVNGNDTRVTANVYMPKGKLAVRGRSGLCIMTGMFIAEDIESENLVTWNGYSCTLPGTYVRMASGASPTDLSVQKQRTAFNVSVSPNPSANDFRLSVNSLSNEPVQVRIVDTRGVEISVLTQKLKGSVISLGSGWKTGTYFAEVIQGDQRQVVKLVKIN